MVHFVIKCDKLKEMSDAEVISYPKIIHMFSSHIPSLSLLRIILEFIVCVRVLENDFIWTFLDRKGVQIGKDNDKE